MRASIAILLIALLVVGAGLFLWRMNEAEDSAAPAKHATKVVELPQPVQVPGDSGPRLEGAAPSSIPGQPAETPLPGGSIVGQVVEGDDSAGFDNALGLEDRGVAGAIVEVRRALPAQMTEAYDPGETLWETLDTLSRWKAKEPLLGTATTDAKGNFQVDGVPEGPAWVRARAEGRSGSVITSVSRTADDRPVLITLAPKAILEGTVVTEAGVPVAGARVVRYSDAGDLAQEVTASDAEGRFRVEIPAASGSELLCVRAEGHPVALVQVVDGQRTVHVVLGSAAALRARVVLDVDGSPVVGAKLVVAVGEEGDVQGSIASGVTDDAGEVVLSVQPGVVDGVVILHPSHAEVFEFGSTGASSRMEWPADPRVGPGETRMTFKIPSGVRITGRVVTEAGEPVAGAVCRLPAFRPRDVRTTTGADGRYELAAPLGEGWQTVSLIVEADGLAQIPDSTEIRAPTQTAVRLEHDVVMRVAAVVRGRVLRDDGRPTEGAIVYLLRLGQAPIAFGSLMIEGELTMTDSGGRYELPHVWAESGLRIQAYDTEFVNTLSAPFDATAGRRIDLPDLRLRRGVRLAVRVLDARGGPIENAKVVVSRTVDDDGHSPVEGTGADGTAEFEALPAGFVFVTAETASMAPTHKRVALEGDGTVQRVELRLADGAVVSGRILDGEGQPVTDHPLVCVRSRQGFADDEGRFRLEGVAAGPLEIHVFAAGRVMQRVPLEAAKTDVEIVLAPPIPDAASHADEAKRLREEAEAQRVRATDAEEHARLLDLVQELTFEEGFLRGERSPPGVPSCGGSCGCGK